MGIKSTIDMSGTVVGGVTLGEPAVHEDGTFEWDGGVPNGVVSEFGQFLGDGEEAVEVPVTEIAPEVKFPEWVAPNTVLKPGDPGRAPGTLGPDDPGVPATPDVVSQPYAAKTVVADSDGVLWVSLIDANVWAPGVSGWRRFSEDPNAVQPWVQPTGAHDAYQIGDEVFYESANFPQFTIWRSKIAANVTVPGTDGNFHRWWEPVR